MHTRMTLSIVLLILLSSFARAEWRFEGETGGVYDSNLSNSQTARATLSHHPSTRVDAELISTTGVPSNASIGPIFMRLPSISRTITGCSPRGFGRGAGGGKTPPGAGR